MGSVRGSGGGVLAYKALKCGGYNVTDRQTVQTAATATHCK